MCILPMIGALPAPHVGRLVGAGGAADQALGGDCGTGLVEVLEDAEPALTRVLAAVKRTRLIDPLNAVAACSWFSGYST